MGGCTAGHAATDACGMNEIAPIAAIEGTIRQDVELAPLAWFRVGGPASYLAQPKDAEDLATLLKQLSDDLPIMPMGVASNMLIRDGGFEGLVIRFGGPLARVEVDGDTVIAGAGALDQRVAQVAQKAGLSGLEFMIGIPGTIGGACRMNAGAFGGETADRFLWADTLDRDGRAHRLDPSVMGFAYRHSAWPADHILTRAAFRGSQGDASTILNRMEDIKAERAAAQPLKVATGGSTFKNPEGGRAWQLIDAAGCRGLRRGHAMVSDKHCNFLINLGGARAAEIEDLGEEVRYRVKRHSDIELEWEIKRIGRPHQQAALQ